MASSDWSMADSYLLWDFTEYHSLADLLAELRARGYGQGYDCDVFACMEGEELARMIPSDVVRRWMGLVSESRP